MHTHVPWCHGVDLNHPLEFLPNSLVIEIQSNEVKNVTWLKGNINTCHERHLESDPGIVEQVAVKHDSNFEVHHEQWIYTEHPNEFEYSRGMFDFVAYPFVSGPTVRDLG